MGAGGRGRPGRGGRKSLPDRTPTRQAGRHLVEAVPRADIENTPFASILIKAHIERAGLTLGGIPPGFYLVHAGVIAAYHPGTPTAEEVVGGAAFGVGAGLFASAFGARNAAEVGVRATAGAWEAAVSVRVFAFFEQVIDPLLADDLAATWREFARALQIRMVDEALVSAAAVLGVGQEADEATVRRAYHGRAREMHSDRNPEKGDSDMKALNGAKDLNYSRRGWKL